MIRTLAALLLILPALQEKKPADVFKALETKLLEAKTLSVSVKIEMPPGNLAGTLLFGEGNKAFVDFVPAEGDQMKLTVVSDGAKIKRTDGDKYDVETPKELNANLKKAFARMGAMGVGYILAEEKGNPTDGVDAAIKVSDFALGAAEKVADKETTVLTYKVTIKENGTDQAMDVKVWIGADGLPVKRTLSMKQGEDVMTSTETFTSIKMNEALDAKKFENAK